MQDLSIEQKIQYIEQTKSFGDIKQAWFPPSVSDGYYFVSYCHKDYKKVFKDIYRMQCVDDPIAVWYDKELNAGKDWHKEAERHIYDFNCKGIIFYISENSVISPAIFKEMQIVLDSAKPFLPIALPYGENEEYIPGSELFKKMNPDLAEASPEYSLYEKMFGQNITYIKYSDSARDKLDLIRKSFVLPPLLEIGYRKKNKDLFGTLIGSEAAVVACNDTNVVNVVGSDFTFTGNYDKSDCAEIIGDCAFAHCRQLKTVEFPTRLRKIETYAFFNCRNLEAADIPASVSDIGTGAFRNCYKLKSVTMSSDYLSMGNSVFLSCGGLEHVELPKNIHFIKPYTFRDCTSLESIDLSSVMGIDTCAFYGCKKLKTVTFSDELTDIGMEAFAFCEGMTQFNMPNSVTKLGLGAFKRCTSLSKISLSEKITAIPSELFLQCYALREFDIPKNIESIGAKAFSVCFNLEKITLHDGIKSIDSGAFEETGIMSIELPDSIESISPEMFKSCVSLYRIKMDGVKYIGEKAFFECLGMREISLPQKLEVIGWGAFGKSDELATVKLPHGLQRIESMAFGDCSALKNIYYDGTVAEWRRIRKDNNWDAKTDNYTVHCNDGDIYKNR